MEYKTLVEQLLCSYKKIFAKQSSAGEPSWAQHKKCTPNELVRPTIPFVGKDYTSQKTKIMLYASAENLSDYTGRDGGWLDDDAKAINRHREWFNNKSVEFFPSVQIAPVSDGSLIIALRYICEKLNIEMPTTPKDFVESIAIANFGKFSIENGTKNKDYAKDKEKLDCSLEYIKTELSILRPDIIVMFKSIYSTEKDEINAVKGDARVICTYQINAQTVNRLIHKNYFPKDINELSATIQNWYDKKHFHKNKFTNKTHDNFLSVFTYLDMVLKNYQSL